MTLTTRRLGTTDMEITRLGFGAWAIGGGEWAFGWGDQDDSESVAAIRHAVDSGINWIDTASVYGLGHSEEVVAKALKDLPEGDRPYVFTKCGMVWDVEQPFLQAKRVGRADSIRKDVEDSLRRLQVERIDLMQVHWPAEDGSPIEEYWGELVKLRDEGKLRAIGLSNHDAAALERAEAIGHVDSLQPPFSMIRREALADILPWCATHDTGVIVYSPMQSGLLTGAFDRERVAGLDPKDWRSRNPEFTTNLDKNMALVERLRSVADRLGCSPGEVALAWVLTHDAVTGAIVGALRPDQVDGWIGGADVTLDEATLAELANALTATGAGAGPLD